MIKELEEKRKILGNFKINLFYIGVVLCILFSIFLIVYVECISEAIGTLLGLAVLLPSMILLFLYFMYLESLYDMKRKLQIEETDITPEMVRECLNKAFKETLEESLEKLNREDQRLAILKEKAYKTSNPFLIKKYIKKKEELEWFSFEIEIYLEYKNRDVIHKLEALRDSEIAVSYTHLTLPTTSQV